MAQHLVRQLMEAESIGKGLPIAIAIGTDPVIAAGDPMDGAVRHR